MGYCACRRRESTLLPVLAVLAVVAVLMIIPWFFSLLPLPEIEPAVPQINLGLILVPLLLLAIVHWLSSKEPPCAPPPPCWCYGKKPCWCGHRF